VMMRRSNFRDYYDIYSLLQHGIVFQSMVELALEYSGHLLHTKNLYSMLSNGSRFTTDTNFTQLCPAYGVTAKEIEEHIRTILTKGSVNL